MHGTLVNVHAEESPRRAGSVFGSPAIFLRPVTLRPDFATGLPFRMLRTSSVHQESSPCETRTHLKHVSIPFGVKLSEKWLLDNEDVLQFAVWIE